MYDLVNQISAYPEFLSWCAQARILKQTKAQITATIQINKGALKQSFTTINSLTPDRRIEMRLSQGIFKTLNGGWVFTPLGAAACRVDLTLEFDFANVLLDFTLAPIFTKIANVQLDAFVARAKQIYD